MEMLCRTYGNRGDHVVTPQQHSGIGLHKEDMPYIVQLTQADEPKHMAMKLAARLALPG